MADFKQNVRLTLIQLMIFEPYQKFWISELKAILTRVK
jgi:hypothetical protein